MDGTLAEAVGQRIRRLWVQAGKGVREQAREIGISVSSLSALENNRGGMSLRRLQMVAAHFDLHITDLLAQDEDGSADDGAPFKPEVIKGWANSTAGVSRGKGVHYQLMGHGGDHQIQPYLIAFEPGGSYQDDKIGHPGEEFGYVLIGAVELVSDEGVQRLAQGDAIRFSCQVPHAFRNASETGVAVLIGCASPPW